MRGMDESVFEKIFCSFLTLLWWSNIVSLSLSSVCLVTLL